MTQRYLETHINGGKFFSEGSCESYEDWLESPFYTFEFTRAAEDRSTFCQISLDFGDNTAMATNGLVLIVAHYDNLVSVTTLNGYTTDVTSVKA